MRSKYLVTGGLAVLLATSFAGLPRAYQQETVDLASIEKIKAIGLDPNASKVMEIASYLTDVYGPRLSGSTNIKKAGDWTVGKMKEWGLVNAALEPWPADPSGQNGGFPCGWSNDKFYLSAVTPQAFPIHGTPTGWTPGTNGLVRGEVVYIPSDMTEEALKEKFAGGKLKGKWVIGAVAPEVDAFSTPRSVRYTTEQLDRMENPPPPPPADPNAPARGGRAGQAAQAGQAGRAGAPPAAGVAGVPAAPAAGRAAATPAPPPPPPPVRKDVCKGETPDPAWVKAQAEAQAAAQAAQAAQAAAAAAAGVNPAAGAQGAGAGRAGGGGGRGGQGGGFNRNAYFKEQGILGTFTTAAGGRGGGATGHGVYTIGGGGIGTDPATKLTSVTISPEDYGRIYRMVTKGVPVIVEADIRNTFTPNPPMFNVIGEIRGTDKADEVVMLGAHFDSWHASTGATDNAAGSAAMLEAMRILKASGVRLRRTVRIGLWSGEEQGLIGSARYVAAHFGGARGRGGAPPAPTTPEHAKFSGYFNIDNGTGAIRGVYLQNNAAVGPIFKEWMKPFNSIGMTHITAGTTGGTDHGSFDNVGLPGWQFIQDAIEYGSLTHHTNLDSYERLQAEDMRKNATIAAAFAYLTANREQLLPRKPPATPGAGRGGQ